MGCTGELRQCASAAPDRWRSWKLRGCTSDHRPVIHEGIDELFMNGESKSPSVLSVGGSLRSINTKKNQKSVCGADVGRCQRPPVETKDRAHTNSPLSGRGPPVRRPSAPLPLAQAFIRQIEVVQRGHNGPRSAPPLPAESPPSHQT